MAAQKKKAYIYDPERGEVFEIDSSDLVKEIRGGAELASPEQIQRIKTNELLAEKFGTPGQKALGVAEEVASTLTFGASRAAQNILGVDQEGMEYRADEVSPLVTGATMLVPAVLSGGTSAVVQGGAKAAAKAGAKAAAKVGAKGLVKGGAKAVAEGIVPAARLSAPGLIFRGEQAIARRITPEGAGVLRKAAGQAVGGAVGGAAITAGELISETALGRPPELGEDLVSRIGMNALLGGAGGAAFELGAGAVSASARASRDAIKRTWRSVADKYPNHAKKLLGEGFGDAIDELYATRGAARRSDWVEDAAKKGRTPVGEGPAAFEPEPVVKTPKRRAKELVEDFDVDDIGTSIERQIGALDDANETLFKHIRPAEREALGDVSAINFNAAKDQAASLEARGLKVLAEMDADPLRYGADAAKLKKALEKARSKLAAADVVEDGAGTRIFAALDDLKRDISEAGLSRRHLVSGFYGNIRESLEDALVWDKLAIRQLELNKAYTRYMAIAGPKADGSFIKRYTTKALETDAKRVRVVDRVKLRKLLENIDDPAYAHDVRQMREYMTASRNLVDQIEQSAKHAPGQFERTTIDAALDRTRERLNAAGEVTRGRKDLTDHLTAQAESAKDRNVQGKAAHKDAVAAHKKAVADEADAVQKRTRMLSGADAPHMPSLAFGLGLGIGVHPALGIPYAALRLRSFLDAPAKAIRTMGIIENAAVSVNNAIEKLSATIAKGARPLARSGKIAGVATYAKEAQRTRRLYDERVEMIQLLANNPEAMVERLSDLTSGFGEEAPKTAAAAQMTAVRFVSHMASQVPRKPDMGALGGKWVTPNNEASAFNRKFEVASGGVPKLLEMASEGNVLASDVEASAAVYPEQYARMVSALVSHTLLRDLSGKTLQTVQTLLGHPVTSAQQPASVASMQGVYAAVAQGQGVAPSHKGKDTVDLSKRMRTGVDADGPVGEREA